MHTVLGQHAAAPACPTIRSWTAEAWEPRSTAHGVKYRGPARKLLAARRTKSSRSFDIRRLLAEATLITGSSQTSAARVLAEPNYAFTFAPAPESISTCALRLPAPPPTRTKAETSTLPRRPALQQPWLFPRYGRSAPGGGRRIGLRCLHDSSYPTMRRATSALYPRTCSGTCSPTLPLVSPREAHLSCSHTEFPLLG